MRESKRNAFMVCLLGVAGMFAIEGCGDESKTTYITVACQTGDTQVCLCEDGSIGTQSCITGEDGSTRYGTCTCTQKQPEVKLTPCDGITCDNGVCVPVTNDTAACICYGSYLSGRDDNGKPICIKDESSIVTNKCDNIDCAGHGACVNTAEKAICICENGYVSAVDSVLHTPTCEKSPAAPVHVCDAIDCAGHGVCLEGDKLGEKSAVCRCDDGYSASIDGDGNPTCEEGMPTSGPCKDVTCSNHGACVVTGEEEAYCLCDTGYIQSSPTECEVDSTSSCAEVDCGGHGFCGLVNGDATCWCMDGYELDDSGDVPTCNEKSPNDNPCADVTCSNHGICVVNGNAPYCLCDDGYHQGSDARICDPIDIVESPCKDITCSEHGACVVTGDNQPYCLCDAGYHQGSDAKTCDIDIVEDSPCQDVTCSDHGVCIITGSNTPYCICESGYDTKEQTSCVKSNAGVSNGNAYPYEVVDPWGLVWDFMQRPTKTYAEADALCKSYGGRLPSRNEIFRNNHTSGVGGIGDLYQTSYLWTDESFPAVYTRTRLSDGARDSNSADKSPFRCVWDPEERPIIMTGVNCNGLPSDSDQCIHITMGDSRTHVTYTVDREDRATLPWHVAQQECRKMGGRLPSANELVTLVLAGLPNGSGSNLWTSDNIYNYNPLVFKWSGTQNSSYAFNSNWTYVDRTSFNKYRCVYEDVEIVDNKPVFPQAKAKDAMEVTPMLRIDNTERASTTYWNAMLACREDGGRLASVDEMEAAIRAGLSFTNNNYHLTRNSYNANIWLLRSGVTSGKPGTKWNIANNLSNASLTSSYAYFCTYRPNRDYAEMVEDLEKRTVDGYAYRVMQDFSSDGGGKIYHYIRDLNDRAGANIVTNTTGSNANGMFLPTVDDLAFMIRHGLVGGNNVYLMTNTTAGNVSYRALRWSGAGTETYAPGSNATTISWSMTSNPYRAYYSSVVY